MPASLTGTAERRLKKSGIYLTKTSPFNRNFMTKTVFIAGSGGIGEAAALLLCEWADFEIEIILGDISEESLARARQFVTDGSDKTSGVETVLVSPDGVSDQMRSACEKADVLLDCSPGGQAPQMAAYAKEFGMHYANLTEYVAETDKIIELAKHADTGFVLQTGLAPGFINVLAMSLYHKFVANFENERVERIGMKVGALTAHAHQPHFYGFTWSPIGVATEYVKNSRVIRDYMITERPALSSRETIVIGGRTYEADLTSAARRTCPTSLKARRRPWTTKRCVTSGITIGWSRSFASCRRRLSCPTSCRK